jgi:hypothetical protein
MSMTNLLTSTKLAVVAALTLTGIVVALAVSPVGRSQPAPDEPFSSTALKLRTMVLDENELPGFTSVECPLVQMSVGDWVGANTDAIPALRTDGFVMGLRETLRSAKLGASAASVAINFHSAAGAATHLMRQLATVRNEGTVTAFSVAAIAGAQGYQATTRTGIRDTIGFTSGSNEYLLSVAFDHGSQALSTAQLLKAALHVYLRTTGGEYTTAPVVRHHP